MCSGDFIFVLAEAFHILVLRLFHCPQDSQFGFSGRVGSVPSEPPGCWVCLCLGPSPSLLVLPLQHHSSSHLQPLSKNSLPLLFTCAPVSSDVIPHIHCSCDFVTYVDTGTCPHMFIQSWKNASHSLSLQPDHPRTQPRPQPPYGNFYSEVLFTLWFSLAVRGTFCHCLFLCLCDF